MGSRARPTPKVASSQDASSLYNIRRETASRDPAAQGALKMVSQVLKSSVQGMNAKDVRAQMEEKYKTFRLIDDDGKWMIPELEDHADVLLPEDLDGKKIEAFIDEMARPLSRNPLVMRFFKAASKTKFPQLRKHLAAEGKSILPDVLVYAQVLDRLTKVLASDYRLSEVTPNPLAGV